MAQFLRVQYYHNLECMRDIKRERVTETDRETGIRTNFQIYKRRAVFTQERVKFNHLTDGHKKYLSLFCNSVLLTNSRF